MFELQVLYNAREFRKNVTIIKSLKLLTYIEVCDLIPTLPTALSIKVVIAVAYLLADKNLTWCLLFESYCITFFPGPTQQLQQIINGISNVKPHGYFYLVSELRSKLVIDINSPVGKGASLITQYRDSNRITQLWEWDNSQVVSMQKNLVVQAKTESKVYAWDSHNGINQKWEFYDGKTI